MKQIHKRLTYANVMSSLAVFLILGGATAFAAVSKVGANEIKANSIKTGKIVKEAVTAGKLKQGAVTESRIADGAVTTNKLADNAVTAPKIAKDAVTTEKVLNNAITNGKIANDAVTTTKLANDAVTTTKLADGAVTSAKLGVDSVGSSQVKAGSLQAANISTFETTATLNFASLAAGTCERQLTTIPGSGNTADDSVLVTANADDLVLAPPGGGFNLVVLGQGSNATNTYRIVLCNPSVAAVDPPNTRFYVTAFAR